MGVGTPARVAWLLCSYIGLIGGIVLYNLKAYFDSKIQAAVIFVIEPCILGDVLIEIVIGINRLLNFLADDICRNV